MSKLEEARSLLYKVIQDVANHATSFYTQIEQIKKTESELKLLIDEEQYLKDQICKEEKISEAYENLLSFQEEEKNDNIKRYEKLVDLFRNEVLKNAKYAISEGKRPLIFCGRGVGPSPLILNIRYKSRIIKKKAEITRKIYHLYQLQQKVFCLSEDYDNNFSNYQINQNVDYSVYKMENFSNSIKDKLSSYETPNFGFLTPNSISDVATFFSRSLSLSNDNKNKNIISVPNFTFKQSIPFNKRDTSTYFAEFNRLISPTLHEIISNIDDLLKEMSEIFQMENSTIKTSTENFFRSNPSFIHTPSALYSNIIFKTQEKIIEAQKMAFLINQNILSPDTKLQNESYHIQYLIDELASIFDTIYDRLSRNQIISQNISLDFDYSKFQYFTVDEISRAQIEKCNSIVNEIKKIFEKSSAVNKSFFGILNDILTRSRNIQSSRPKIDLDINIAPPTQIDDTDIKEKFLSLKQRILKKQSEQLNSFIDAIEELPPEIKEIRMKDDNFKFRQPPIKTGLHFPKRDDDNGDQNDISIKLLPSDSSINDKLIKSNPYQDSNQNLLDKILQKEREHPESKIIKSKTRSISNNDNNDQTDNDATNSILDKSRKYYNLIENIKNNLSTSINNDNIDELKNRRTALLEELQQKTEKFNISQTQKNERMMKKLTERDQIKVVKEKRDQLRNELDENRSQFNNFSNDINSVQKEIQLLIDEKDELEARQARIELLQSKYENLVQQIKDIEEEEKKFKETLADQK